MRGVGMGWMMRGAVVWTCASLLLGCQRREPGGDVPQPAGESTAKPTSDAGSPSPQPSASSSAAAPSDPPGFYLGREIAKTMSYHGADWLVRPEREEEENASRLLTELRLAPGMTACDLGAGNGYHTLMMAKAVAPKGKAIAVDIQPEMLDLLAERAKEEGIHNVETILGGEAESRLPDATCDVVLMVDVYHELSDPAAMLQSLKAALTEDGVIALVEFRAEDPEVPIKRLHKMSKKQILIEYGSNGYELTRSFEGLPWQHLMFFAPR